MAEKDEKITTTGAKSATREDSPGVATLDANRKLEHTMGGSTTRDDAHDLGVPMIQGSPDEPQGPEDALGEGPKRGDYRDRIGPSNYQPHETIVVVDDDGNESTVMAPQRPRTDDIGDDPGEKGGVTT